jgi:hypothetical protein
MDDLFKQNLLKLRQPASPRTFGEALFNASFWRPQKNLRNAPVVAPLEGHGHFSEKKQVLESLERFAQDKLEQSSSGVVEVEGGEIVRKNPSNVRPISLYQSFDELKKNLSIPNEFLNLLLSNKINGKVKVIFVTEAFRDWKDVEAELRQGFVNELLTGFPLKTAEFFERMINAMKLEGDEVILYPADKEGNDLSAEILSLAAYFKAEVVITLGAKASQTILKTNDRLTLIHGQFFPIKMSEEFDFQVVPLFHPSIIETNQNMKKTAWIDMQKIMRHLKKLP